MIEKEPINKEVTNPEKKLKRGRLYNIVHGAAGGSLAIGFSYKTGESLARGDYVGLISSGFLGVFFAFDFFSV